MRRRWLHLILATVFVLALVAPGAQAITKVGVIGGQEATEDYAFMVSLQRSNGNHFCGGSLIARKLVLTAAHCVEGEEAVGLQVMLGSENLMTPGEVIRVAKITIHEAYNSSTSENDLAILKLAKKSKQRPVPIATLDQKDLWAPGTTARVIGWGTSFWQVGPAPDVLHEVDVPIVSDSNCARSYDMTMGFYPGTMVCAGEDTGMKDSCQGDSGGPLLVRDENDDLVQMGVVSWGLGCGFPLMYGVYARIGDDALRPWLESTAKI